MTNKDIAHLLHNVAAAYSVTDDKKYRFQIIAYQKAADAIENSTAEVSDLYKENKLDTIDGVGPSIQKHLTELFEKGSVKHFETILSEVPSAMFPLLNIPSFGPKKAYRLVIHFKLTDPKKVIDELFELAKKGKIAPLEGFGEKSQADIVRAIEEFKKGVGKNVRMVLPFASELADKMITYLKSSPHVLEAFPLGSLRRRKETIGDVDIAVTSKSPAEAIQHFVDYPYKDRVIEKGTITASILMSGGKHVDIMVLPPENLGSMLQHFTGSKNHNVHLREYSLKKGFSLSEKGIKLLRPKSPDDSFHSGSRLNRDEGQNEDEELVTFDSEEKFYKYLGMQWIPPEIREDTGEIELAIENRLPKLVELSDIKGDFHLHSNFPIEESHDKGQSSMEDMIKKAKTLGYKYLAFSEHNPSVMRHNSEQTYQLLKRRQEHIAQLQKKTKSLQVISLLETDILASGDLAIDNKSLQLLDGSIVSIHSVFSMDKKTMTKRILQGLSHPKAKILAHPTGRLLNERPGYDVDWTELFKFCKEHNKALEINAWPLRLDLPDTLIKQAKDMDLKFVINTDSHEVSQMDMMQYGVSVARRGWATTDDIINTWEYNRVKKWLEGGDKL